MVGRIPKAPRPPRKTPPKRVNRRDYRLYKTVHQEVKAMIRQSEEVIESITDPLSPVFGLPLPNHLGEVLQDRHLYESGLERFNVAPVIQLEQYIDSMARYAGRNAARVAAMRIAARDMLRRGQASPDAVNLVLSFLT